MKRVLLVSIATSLFVAACGEKTELKLQARNMKDNHLQTGPQTPQNPSDKVNAGEDRLFLTPAETSQRKIQINGHATRIVNVQGDDMETTVFCAENLVKSHKENGRIKLQGKSQIILRQSTKTAIPELTNKLPKEEPKTFISLACLGASADLSKEPENSNIKVANLVEGETIAVLGKFSSLVAAFETTAQVGCVSAEKIAKANEALSPDDKNKPLDILMATNSKILVETSSDNLKNYILVTCDEHP